MLVSGIGRRVIEDKMHFLVSRILAKDIRSTSTALRTRDGWSSERGNAIEVSVSFEL